MLAGCSALKGDDSSARYPDVEPSDAVEAGADDPDGGRDVASDGDASLSDRSLDGSPYDGIDAGQDEANDRSDALRDMSIADDENTSDGSDVDALDDLRSERGQVDGGPTCESNCSNFGEFRCAIEEAGIARHVEICASLAPGCLRWMDSAFCAPDEVCCQGSCRRLGSPSACVDPFDLYVDAAQGSDDVEAGSGLGGTWRNPFRTVSRAVLEATIVGRARMRIYIGPGLYDAALGESFPIVLRGGLSLYGAGSSLVTIRGAGDFSTPIGGGLVGSLEKVTIVAGDITEKTTISDVTVRAVPDVATLYNIGVYCDRGSAPSTGASVGVTSIENAVIGPGYDSAITAFSSAAPAPSGCNLRMTGSRVTGAFNGVLANGCRSGASQPRQVAVQIGTAEKGNVFTALNSDNSDSAGLLLQACVASGYIFSNTFQDSPEGIRIAQQSDPGVATHPFVINGNTFTRLSHVGLTVFGVAPVVDLNDNTFTLNKSPANANYGAAIGLWAFGNNAPGGYVPIRKARRNTFFANDVGVFLESVYNVATTEGGHLDFGTANDPGGNVFRCNSSESHGGIDVRLKMSSADTIPLHFVGNTWDHFPPFMSRDGAFYDGTDNLLSWNLELATEGGRSDWTPCPPHHIPGPAPPPPDSGTE